MGKSWLIRTETYRLAQLASKLLADPAVTVEDVLIPVPIRADVLAGRPGRTMAEAVTGHMIDEGLLASASRKRMLERINGGGVVLLIDALDEVPRDAPAPGAQAPGKRLEDLLRHWTENCTGIARCVLTSRLAGYVGPPVPGAREVELLPFTPKDVETAISAWNLSSSALARVRALLRDPAPAGMARIPLLLALICSLAAEFPDQHRLPTTRAELYEAVLWQFLSGSHRSADRGGPAQALSPAERQNLLQVLTVVAMRFADTDRGWIYQMPHGELVAALRRRGGSYLGNGGSAATALARLVDQAGLLVPVGNPLLREQSYVFLHRTIAEYLVARGLCQLPQRQWMQVVEDHQWFDPDWAEVIPMLGGLLARQEPGDAQVLVEHLLTQRPDPLHHAFHTALRVLGECLEPDRLLTGALARELGVRTGSLLKRDVTGTELLRVLTAAPRWPRPVTDVMLGRLNDERVYLSEAFESLSERTEPGVTEALLDLLGDEDPRVRESAIWKLGGRQGAQVTQGLLALLQDTMWFVRFNAVQALAHRNEPEVTEALLARLRDEEWHVRAAAVRALGFTLPLQAVLDWLKDKNPEIRSATIEVLTGRPEAGVTEALLAQLGDHHADVRRAATRALARSRKPEVTDALLARLDDERGFVQHAAIEALADRPGSQVTSALLARLADPESETRVAAINALAQRPEPDVTEALIACLADSDMRVAAIEALGARPEPTVTEALLAQVGAKGWLGVAVIQALAERPEPQVTEALLPQLRDSDPDDLEDQMVLEATIAELRRRSGPNVTDALLARLEDADRWRHDDWLRERIIPALAGRPESRVTEALLAQLGNHDISVRKRALLALAGRDDPGVIEALLAHLDDDGYVQHAAVDVLAERDDPEVSAGLLTRLTHKNPQVREAAAKLLAGRQERGVTRALFALLDDENPDVRRAATDSLATSNDPLTLILVAKPNVHTSWPHRGRSPRTATEIRFEVASKIADRTYLMLPPKEKAKIWRYLGRLTRKVSRS
jgi:HEAT repeat protein